MEFSTQQQQALDAVAAWLRNPDQQVFRLFGYAGTGKTTIARYLDADLYAAFTGKAALVLREKGCHDARTIHSLIYLPHEKSQERLRTLLEQAAKDPDDVVLRAKIDAEKANLRRPSFTLNLDSELNGARLLVIDECSMVGEEIGMDLLSFGTKVLVLGDTAQLPPIRGGGFFTEHTPDILLTEVHRQARDNPILDLATIVRETGRLPEDHSCVIGRDEVTTEAMLQAEQIIVGRNETRRKHNAWARRQRGFTNPFPQIGDKLVCLRNNHQLGLLNGGLHMVTQVESEDILELDGSQLVEVHLEYFTGDEDKIPVWAWRDAQAFDYGYALTCHKAQGSQWKSVGVINESGAFRGHSARWLYTAITRASETLWVTR